jgi:hypothetical protein
MDRPLTPEHLQLLSDEKLRDATEPKRAPSSDYDRALVRMARYETYRRRCEVPVRDRYGHV